jgi:uncharacterized protein
VQLINGRTRKPIAQSVELADSRKTRRRGLLGRDSLPEDGALMLIPCAAVHTAFMRFSIDVVFLDRNACVVRTVPALAPWRMALCWRARSVVELPAGRIAAASVQPGDCLYLAPVSERRAS